MTDTHSKIIATAGKSALAPLGFKRKGRSRLWISDQMSWLNVVEFTPSRWSKGVSLVNASHWLWAGTGFLAFHESVHSDLHAEFESGEQFEREMEKIAHEAVAEARRLQAQFSSLERTAAFVIDRARSSPDRMLPSWWGYQAGIAAGLIGDLVAARSFLEAIRDERVVGHAAKILPVVGDSQEFKAQVSELVAKQRHKLTLPSLEQPPF